MFQLRQRNYQKEELQDSQTTQRQHHADILGDSTTFNKVTSTEDPLTRSRVQPERKAPKAYCPSSSLKETTVIHVSNHGVVQSTTLAGFIESLVRCKEEMATQIRSGNMKSVISTITSIIDCLDVNSDQTAFACIHDYVMSLMSTFNKELLMKLEGVQDDQKRSTFADYERYTREAIKAVNPRLFEVNVHACVNTHSTDTS